MSSTYMSHVYSISQTIERRGLLLGTRRRLTADENEAPGCLFPTTAVSRQFETTLAVS